MSPFHHGTPVPNCSLVSGQWDFWEFWSGSGKLTATCIRKGLKCGPPLSHETGWCFLLPAHREAIKQLYLEHRPLVLWGSPLCSPWSTANTTMNPDLKKLVRQQQIEYFSFYADLCHLQYHCGRAWLLEQPKGSQLLREPVCLNLLALNAHDSNLCMCAHGLAGPVNGKPCKKETTIRGTNGVITDRAAVWCSGDHQHQVLEGKLPNVSSAHLQPRTSLNSFVLGLLMTSVTT